MTALRWFYVFAQTPRGPVDCGKVQATETEIRRAFNGCTITESGVVAVYRGPNDTKESMRHVNAAASNANVVSLGRRKVHA